MNLAIELNGIHFTLRVADFIIENNHILMAKHKNFSMYYTPAGKVQINETTEAALLRELREEIGIDYEIENLAIVQERFYTAQNQEQHEITFFYKMKENSATTMLVNAYTDQGEDEMMYLLDIKNIRRYNIVPAFLQDIQFTDLCRLQHIVTGI